METVAQVVKCGYCNYVLSSFLNNILEHSCFEGFDPKIQAIYIDDNGMLTMINQTENKSVDDSALGNFDDPDDDTTAQASEDENGLNDASQSNEADGFSSGLYDEQLISLVQSQPALYDHRLPSVERSKLKKKDMWKVISNNFEGELFTPINAEKRWNYLRENYPKARRKFLAAQYTATKSGSAATSVVQPTYRHYEIMNFLNDSVTYKTTISSLKSKSKAANVKNRKSVSNTSGNKENEDESLAVSDSNEGHEFEVQIHPSTSTEQTLHSTRPVLNPSNNNMPLAPASHTRQASVSPQQLSITPPSTNTSCNSRKRKSTFDIEHQLVQMLQKESKETDEVDGFLLRMGAGLRRLSYPARARLEIKFLTSLNEEEEIENDLQK